MLIRTYLVNIPFFTHCFVALFLKFFGEIHQSVPAKVSLKLISPFCPLMLRSRIVVGTSKHQFFQPPRSFWGVQRLGEKLAARCASRTSTWSLQLLDEAVKSTDSEISRSDPMFGKKWGETKRRRNLKKKWFLMKLPEMILKWAFLLLNLLILLIWSWKCNLDHSSGWVC